MEKITACLITKQPEYPSLVWERLTLGFFDEIIVELESPSVYKRYEIAKSAKNDIIYFQDDDAILNYQSLHKHFDGTLTTAMPKEFAEKYRKMGCSLVGWGAFAKKETLDVFDAYINKYGVDAHLLREADRIYSFLNRPHKIIIMPHEDLPRANDNSAMWKEPHHFTSAEEALAKCALLRPNQKNPLIQRI